MIKAIFLDYDDTLFSHKTEQVPSSTVRALKAAQLKGVQIILATGRTRAAAGCLDYGSLKLDGYICANGAFIYDSNFQLIHAHYFEGHLKEFFVSMFKAKEVPIILGNEEILLQNLDNDYTHRLQRQVNLTERLGQPYNGMEFGIIHAYYQNAKEMALLDPVADQIEVTYWGPYCLDIMPKGINKAYGVRKMLEILQIQPDECLTFGDNDNDRPMVGELPHGVAVGNGIETLKAEAEYVTSAIDEDGIAKALLHYGVIDSF